MAQLSTTATVQTEVLWAEPGILTITGTTNIEQLQEMLQQKTSGFSARFVGTVPQI